MHIDQRKQLAVSRNLIIHESMVGTIALSGFFLFRPANEFTVIVCSQSLNGCASYREVPLFAYRNKFLRSGYCCNRQQQCR